MFSKLRNKIIVITMATTTAVLIIAGCIIMVSSSATRPEPRFEPMPFVMEDSNSSSLNRNDDANQELMNRIKNDRKEGDIRLLITLICVGIGIEFIVFVITYYLSEKIVAPVKDSYEKQKVFIANASHELKTPLAVIQANAEAMEVDKANQKWKDNIETEITHANKLVLDLLQLARMDTDSTKKTKAEKIDLSAELQNHVDIFRPKFTGTINLKTDTKSTYTLPKQDFLQVIDILLDNATKYGDTKITVRLTSNQISITNDGATIKPEDIDRVFDRFYQTDKTKGGSGLGLAIAKAICEQNNWQISCTSAKKQTTFAITIPHGK